MVAPKYPDELRERAVRLYRTSRPRPTFRARAEQLGVHHEALRNSVRQAEADADDRDDRDDHSENEELRRLRKENAELKRANEILKAASAFSPRRSTRQGGSHSPGGGPTRAVTGHDQPTEAPHQPLTGTFMRRRVGPAGRPIGVVESAPHWPSSIAVGGVR
jgi:transposase